MFHVPGFIDARAAEQNNYLFQYHKLKFVITCAKHWHSFVPFKSCLWCCDKYCCSCQLKLSGLIYQPDFSIFEQRLFVYYWNKLRNRPCMSSCNSTINLFCLLSSFPFWTSDMFRIRLRVSKWPSQIENSQYRFQNIARFAFQY